MCDAYSFSGQSSPIVRLRMSKNVTVIISNPWHLVTETVEPHVGEVTAEKILVIIFFLSGMCQ
jgi:hypothetical protein